MINFLKKHHRLISTITAAVFLVIFVLASYLLPKPEEKPPVIAPTPTATPTVDPRTVPADDSFEYNQALNEVLKKYPWYPKLPLETKDYRVIYDFEQAKFRIRIFNSQVSAGEQKRLIDAALKSLRDLGVDTKKFSYYLVLGT